MSAARTIEYDKGQRIKDEQLKYQRPKQPYTFPPKCDEASCANYAGETTVPRETYWICPKCAAAAPNAYELGYARRPQDYYTNVKPWGPKKRAEWTKAFNASVLLVHLFKPPPAEP
jgi:hypothetical protein